MARLRISYLRFGTRCLAERGRGRVCPKLTKRLGMSRIFFDTNLFIYMLEDQGERAALVRHILERMSARRDELLTSALTLAEVLVKPLSAGDTDWADRYEKMLSSPGVSILPFDKASARICAQLR